MTFTLFIIGAFASWALTWSLVVSDAEGPFRLYQLTRWLLRRSWVPALIRENAGCYVCNSFWAAGLVTLLLPIYKGLSWVESGAMLFVVTYALHGVVVFWFRYIKIMYGVTPDES